MTIKLLEQLKSAVSNPFILQSLKTMTLRVMGMIIIFGFTFFITNTYPAKIVGQYDFVRTFLLIVGTICMLGTDQSILYFSGKLRSSNSVYSLRQVYKKILFILFTMSILLLLLIVAVGETYINNFFNDNQVYRLFFISSLILFFYALSLLNTELFRALEYKYLSELFRNILKYVPVFLAAIILPVFNEEAYLAESFLLGFVLLGVTTTIMSLYYLKRLKQDENEHLISLKEIIITSYPIAVSSMALFLLVSIDIMFLKKYYGDAVVAHYGVAVKMMNILSVIIITVNITLSTQIAELFSAHNNIELQKILKKASRLIFLLTSPAALLLCLFPVTILNLFGEGYASAKNAFIIIILSQWFCSFFGVVPIYLNMTKKQHYFQYILVVAVIINGLLNRFLIPQYGMTGAAISFSVSSVFWNIASAVVIFRTDKINLFNVK
jgi:O-antigen/teichoic acid export membrane protein